MQPAAGQPPEPVASPYQDRAEAIWPGIVRFYPSAEDKANAPPSLIVQIPPGRFASAPENPPVVPKFSRDGERHVATIEIEPGTSLYGCGAVSGPLTLNGRVFVAAPADRDLAPPAEHAASLAIPWVLAVRPNGTAFGVLADTTWRTEIDLTTHIVFRADGPALPVIVVDAATPMEPVQALSLIAGWQELPPLWALGLHLGPRLIGPAADDPLRLPKLWREQGVPGDAVWIDAELFPGASAEVSERLRAPIATLHADGWRAGLNLQPGLFVGPGLGEGQGHSPFKQFAGREIVEEGIRAGHWLRASDGTLYERPFGMAATLVFPDLTRAATRQWWSGLMRSPLSGRFDGVGLSYHPYSNIPDAADHWVRDGVQHHADEELGGTALHSKFRGAFGAFLASAAKDGLRTAFPDKRPFVASAAPSIISQRYAYFLHERLWWKRSQTIDDTIGAVLNAGLSGQVISGVVIPAAGPGSDGSDFARNVAVGALLPLVRLDPGLTGDGAIEPWRFGSEAELACRLAIARRYRLIPYLYTLALEAYRYGQPMMRPYFMGDPANAAVRDVTKTFLLGQDLAVRLRPRDGEEGGPVPEGWRRFDFGEESELLPELYLRPGAILPVGPVMQHTGEKPLEPLTLIVFLDDQGQANGVLYEDAGDGFEYLQNGCRMAHYQAAIKDGEVVVKMARLDGAMGMAKRKLHVRVLLPDGREATAEYWDALDVHVKLP